MSHVLSSYWRGSIFFKGLSFRAFSQLIMSSFLYCDAHSTTSPKTRGGSFPSNTSSESIIYGGFELSVASMKMWGIVLIPEHSYDDSKEA
jgi:hypothetical protein